MQLGNFKTITSGEKEAWDAALIECGNYDPYHLHAYHTTAESTARETPFLFKFNHSAGTAAFPLLLRKIPAISGGPAVAGFDASSVYFGGVVTSVREENAEFTAAFQSALLYALRELNVIAVFARLHPMLNSHWLLRNIAEIVDHGPTIWIDLKLSDEEYHAQLSKRDRRNILRAQQSFDAVVDRECSHLPEFIEMYYETMIRAGATRDYYYSREYFNTLMTQMSDSAALLFMRNQDALIAGALVFSAGEYLQVHLRATPTQYLRLDGSMGLIDVIRRWGKSRGNTWMSLGGGVGLRTDKLYEFKARFSPIQRIYQSARIIVDADIYNNLNDAYLNYQLKSGLRSNCSNFFPAYRCPVSNIEHKSHAPGIGAELAKV
jgi:hypothetical protein